MQGVKGVTVCSNVVGNNIIHLFKYFFKRYIVQWTENKITSNTKMSPVSSELSSLKLCYFTKINYLETDVMFHKTAVAEWPLPAGDVTWS